MLDWLGQFSEEIWGPLRLLSSRLFLSAVGVLLAGLGTAWVLRKVLEIQNTSEDPRILPRDRGRENAVEAAAALGKPTGAGILFIPIYIVACLIVVPFSLGPATVLIAVLAAAWTGFLDDRAVKPWGEYRKAVIDLAIALFAAAVVLGPESIEIWVPFWAPKVLDATGAPMLATVAIPAMVSWPVGAVVLWVSINTTNCTDGVDGLSGSLLALAFVFLGAILYVAVGNRVVADYLLVPYYAGASAWGIMAFTLLGVLGSYLWFNAHPSRLLMGDAGSRPLGLLLGVFVLATGNVFLLPVVAGIVLVNGGTGLVKVALLRFFRIWIFKEIRFPLHDHVRHKLGWSGTQVLVRFMILQAILAPLLIVVILKVR